MLGQTTATLKDFGRSDCFLRLHIWSADPHSFLEKINIIKLLLLFCQNLVVLQLSTVNISSRYVYLAVFTKNYFNCSIFRMFQRDAHCIEMLHSNIHLHAVPNSGKLIIWKGALRAHGQTTVTLKDFGRSDCFLQLHIWSAGPHSFLVNIQNVAPGATNNHSKVFWLYHME